MFMADDRKERSSEGPGESAGNRDTSGEKAPALPFAAGDDSASMRAIFAVGRRAALDTNNQVFPPSIALVKGTGKDIDFPYVDDPLLARCLQCFDQIACVHMSGLFVRSHMN